MTKQMELTKKIIEARKSGDKALMSKLIKEMNAKTTRKKMMFEKGTWAL